MLRSAPACHLKWWMVTFRGPSTASHSPVAPAGVSLYLPQGVWVWVWVAQWVCGCGGSRRQPIKGRRRACCRAGDRVAQRLLVAVEGSCSWALVADSVVQLCKEQRRFRCPSPDSPAPATATLHTPPTDPCPRRQHALPPACSTPLGHNNPPPPQHTKATHTCTSLGGVHREWRGTSPRPG